VTNRNQGAFSREEERGPWERGCSIRSHKRRDTQKPGSISFLRYQNEQGDFRREKTLGKSAGEPEIIFVKIIYRNSRRYKTTARPTQDELKMQKPEFCNHPLIQSKFLESPLDNFEYDTNIDSFRPSRST